MARRPWRGSASLRLARSKPRSRTSRLDQCVGYAATADPSLGWTLVRLAFGLGSKGFSAADLRISKTARPHLRRTDGRATRSCKKQMAGIFVALRLCDAFAARVLTQRITLKRDPHCAGGAPSYLRPIKADRAAPHPPTPRRPAR